MERTISGVQMALASHWPMYVMDMPTVLMDLMRNTVT